MNTTNIRQAKANPKFHFTARLLCAGTVRTAGDILWLAREDAKRLVPFDPDTIGAGLLTLH
jgi:hypothetical protein